MCKHKSGGMSRPSEKSSADGDSARTATLESSLPSASTESASYAHPRDDGAAAKKPGSMVIRSSQSSGSHRYDPGCVYYSSKPDPQRQHVPSSAHGYASTTSQDYATGDNSHLLVCSLSNWGTSMHPTSSSGEYDYDGATEESPMLLQHPKCLSSSSVVLAKSCDLPLLHHPAHRSQQFVDCRKLMQQEPCKADREFSCSLKSSTKRQQQRRVSAMDPNPAHSSGCAVIFDTSQDLIELEEDSGEDYFELPEIQPSYATNTMSSTKAGRSCQVPKCDSARTYSSMFFSLTNPCQSASSALRSTDSRWDHLHSKQPSVFRIDVSSQQDPPQASGVEEIALSQTYPCPSLNLTPAVEFTLNSDSDSSYEIADHYTSNKETSNIDDQVAKMADFSAQPNKTLPSLPSAAQLSLASSSGDSNAPICKICHTATKEGDPLISPCRCSGTMQYIHCGCLMKWLEISSKRSRKPASCELCQYQYHWHKKFKVRHWQFPPCSRRDKILHLLFFLSVLVMVACATVTVMCFKQDKGMKVDPERTELTQSEIITLVCGVLFFLAFFVAMYVEVKARNTIYKLLVKFVYINQQWYIDEYDKKDGGPVDV